MKKVLCNMNHYYDADKFSTCPHCARAKAFLERSAPAAQHSEPSAQDAPARAGYWSLDDLRGKTALSDTPAPGFSAPLPQEPGDLNIMHTTPLFQPDEMPLPVPPAPAQEQPHCPSCGARLSRQQPFCPFCGARTDEAAPPAPAPAPAPAQEQPHCPSCGARLSRQQPFCPFCGVRIDEPVPPAPVQEQPHCPSCGAQLRRQQPFCPFCGARTDEAVPSAPVPAQQPEPISEPEPPFIPISEPEPEPVQPFIPIPEPEPEPVQPVPESEPEPEQPPAPAPEPEAEPETSPEATPVPVIEPERESVPFPAPASTPVQPPKPAFSPAFVPGDGRTHILYAGETNQIEPVVGWLVCVLGSQQGLSFPLSGGRNRIGRSADMDVCLSSDPEVSRNMHCILTFDPASEAFYLQAGDGRGLTYLNGTLLLNPMQLKAHDLIRVGATTLLFVPLCGESFHWSTYFQKA